jgi:hypothetical protein
MDLAFVLEILVLHVKNVHPQPFSVFLINLLFENRIYFTMFCFTFDTMIYTLFSCNHWRVQYSFQSCEYQQLMKPIKQLSCVA